MAKLQMYTLFFLKKRLINLPFFFNNFTSSVCFRTEASCCYALSMHSKGYSYKITFKKIKTVAAGETEGNQVLVQMFCTQKDQRMTIPT